ncbi:hypothetical protein CY35_02G023500 [Sphagnum magellanicum]|nr:hypothetical protein CY35_02G023500 [Sphagnum magellanicum]
MYLPHLYPLSYRATWREKQKTEFLILTRIGRDCFTEDWRRYQNWSGQQCGLMFALICQRFRGFSVKALTEAHVFIHCTIGFFHLELNIIIELPHLHRNDGG